MLGSPSSRECASSLPILAAHGNAARMRTRTVCCTNTYCRFCIHPKPLPEFVSDFMVPTRDPHARALIGSLVSEINGAEQGVHVHLRQVSTRSFPLQRKSRGARMRAKLREFKEELRSRMHHAIPEQGRWLRTVVMGFFAYHGGADECPGCSAHSATMSAISGEERCGVEARRITRRGNA